MRFTSIATLGLFTILLITALPTTLSLSWPLCEDGGNVWVTQRPQTDPQFPGADLFFFCDKGLNLLGKSINNCLPPSPQQQQQQATVCDETMVASAVCRILGYDDVYNNYITFSPASPTEPVVTLTGQYCLREGQFSSQAPTPEELEALPPDQQPCLKLESIACFRSLENISQTLQMTIDVDTLVGDVGAPAVERPPPAVESVIESGSGGVGGKRRMKM
jgi:hypothetical protein